jgi:3-deoxy-manno-octulosonate cytidylyltransferase (CMP-KDO synthetase)
MVNFMQVVGIIPARYGSSRLQGKPLKDIGGKPMIQRVYENAAKAKLLDDLIVATDHQEIFDVVTGFGGKTVMTSPDHSTGTDRVAEAVKDIDTRIIVNIQGDEPFVNPEMLNQVISPLLADPEIPMGTLKYRIKDENVINDPNVVKVVTDKNGFAMYFSRSVIPYPRNFDKAMTYGHIGIYSFQKDFLLKFSSMSPGSLEMAESLEQLRVLENGYRIRVVETSHDLAISVDTSEDLDRARKFHQDNPGQGS